MEKIVDFSKLSIKKIRELIVFTALIVVALWKFDGVKNLESSFASFPSLLVVRSRL